MIKAKVSADYKDIERIFAGGSIQKEILKVWSTEADAYVFEAWRVLEMEGPLPLTFTANGEPLIDYSVYGNTEQTGTPTPENPIIPIGCGERTENLFDKDNYNLIRANAGTGQGALYGDPINSPYSIYIPVTGGETYSFYSQSTLRSSCFTKEVPEIGVSIVLNGTNTFGNVNVRTAPADAKYLVVFLDTGSATQDKVYSDLAILTIVKSQTAPTSYVPYGYKLPILSNSTVTNIYLGEVETTRRIKKLVLTGTEDWTTVKMPTYTYATSITPYVKSSAISSHFIQKDFIILANKTFTLFNKNKIYIKYNDTTSVDDFKQFLSAQYAAGTPVTVWYVLAEPETGIVNEPLMKIGDYADTLSMEQAGVSIPTFAGTTVIDYDGEGHLITSDGYELVDKNQNGFLLSGSTLRPSKMYIKYKGR